MEDDDAMTIEQSILRLPSLRRTAFGGRLSIWVLHSNGMIASSLHDRIRFEEIASITESDSVRHWLDKSHPASQGSTSVLHIAGKVGPMWCAGNDG